jgi:hypothetical protein
MLGPDDQSNGLIPFIPFLRTSQKPGLDFIFSLEPVSIFSASIESFVSVNKLETV